MGYPEVVKFEMGLGVRPFISERNNQGRMVAKQSSPSMHDTIWENNQAIVGDERAIKTALNGSILMQITLGKRGTSRTECS